MPLPDEIVALVRRGKIPAQFRVADVARHIGKFAPNYIKTALANFEKNGNYVQRSTSPPRFRRVARGLYELY